MWSQLVLSVLVGLAYASTSTPAWKDTTEYVYTVNGRTLSSLHESEDQYSGIFLKSVLRLALRSDGKLQGKLEDSQYAQIHTQMPDGWNSNIPEENLVYKSLAFTDKPFQMIIEDGLIKKLIVEKEVANWEANMIKSILSQFQLNVETQNFNSQNDRLEGVFKTMEETVTGTTETLYEFHRLPEYLVQSQPWLVPQKNQEGDLIEITKFKNYTKAQDRPSYNFGMGQIDEPETTGNKIAQFFIRESNSRTIVTGTRSQFVIQNSYTVNKIVANPFLKGHEMGSVISMVNVTLSEINNNPHYINLNNPMEIGSLVYTYETPFSRNNQVHKKLMGKWKQDYSSEETTERNNRRHPRSLKTNEYIQQEQPKSKLSQAHGSPLLPTMVGYHGKSIKENRDFDVKANVEKLVKEISEELKNPQKILEEATMSKYLILNTFVRLLNQEEISSLSDQFYAESEKANWEVFRDSVADSGTGPALLNIRDWVESKKIEGKDAANVISMLAFSARVPTEEFMREFFELITNSEVKDLCTALLAYTDLVRKVYVLESYSHNNFPVHAFGSFYTEEGREFVRNTVIPYLADQLEDAVTKADATKIHLYIRALGQVGDQKILEVFKDYLEGKKQISQFQRMWIVMSFDKLIAANSSVARSVLYKIYQNTGEIPEIRSIAVYQLIRTNPPVEMLQRMAQFTNIDSQEQVNAAVKSVIESLSQTESAKYHELKQAAIVAKPLLTRKQYGADQSYLNIRDWISQEIGTDIFDQIMSVGSTDSIVPKAFEYNEDGKLHGFNRMYVATKIALSNVRDLTNVLYEQTEEYQQEKSQRSQEESNDGQWASGKIADIINYIREEREQLEFALFSEVEPWQDYFSFSNQTLQQLPQMVSQLEEILKQGKEFSTRKIKQTREIALSYPTEMGLPFLYTYDIPLSTNLEGKMAFASTPQLVQNNKFVTPEQMTMEIDATYTLTMRFESRLAFVTPFDHQTYMAGYDREWQFHVPLNGNAEIDFKTKQMKFDWNVEEKHDGARLMHFSGVPYTSRSEIMTTVPIVLRPNTELIKKQQNMHNKFDAVIGKQETGVAVRVWGHHPVQSFDLGNLWRMWKNEKLASMLDDVWDKVSYQHTEFNVQLLPTESTTKKITFRVSYDKKYQKQPETQNEEEFLSLKSLAERLQSDDQQEHQKEMMKHVGSSLQSTNLYSTDVSVEYDGEKKHVLGFATSRSDFSSVSKAIFYYINKSNNKQAAFEARKTSSPGNNALNLTQSLESEPSAEYKVQALYGQASDEDTKVSAEFKLKRSEARKQYLVEEEPMYNVCKQQMEQGNFILPACQNMTIKSNYLDDIQFQIEYKFPYSEYVKALYRAVMVYYSPMMEIQTAGEVNQDIVKGRIQFQPQDFSQINVTVQSEYENVKFVNLSTINGNEVARAFFMPHTVYDAFTRAEGAFRGRQNIRDSCAIDQSAVQTFSNKTYQVTLGDQFTVVMQYVPKQARTNENERKTVGRQLQDQTENYLVLARKLSGNQKEIIFTFNHPQTQGKYVEILLKPDQNKIIAQVNGEQVEFDDKEVAQLYDGFVTIYARSNGQVVLVAEDIFHLIFDGQRFKIISTSTKLQDSIYGLCGRYNSDQYEDFETPAKCILQDSVKFVANYKIDQQQRRRQRSEEWKQNCIAKVLPLYSEVISDNDVGKKSEEQRLNGINQRTKYVEENGEICFTIRPVLECQRRASKTVMKNVSVHCLQGSKTAYHFKSQIDQGGNPDFSRKSETRSIRMEVPVQC